MDLNEIVNLHSFTFMRIDLGKKTFSKWEQSRFTAKWTPGGRKCTGSLLLCLASLRKSTYDAEFIRDMYTTRCKHRFGHLHS